MTIDRKSIAIITPVNDDALTFPETIESLPRSDMDIEWIIIYDGKLALSEIPFKNRMPPYAQILIGDNAGSTAAVNKGLRAARSRYVMFLMGDDLLCSKGLQKAIEVIRSNPKAGILIGNVEFFSFDKTLRKKKESYHPELKWREVLYGKPCLGAYIFDRKLFNDVGIFNPQYDYCSDREFFLRLISYKIPQLRLGKLLYLYRVHSDSETMGRNTHRIIRFVSQHRDLAKWHLRRRTCSRKELRKLAYWHAYETARLLYYYLKGGTVYDAVCLIIHETMARPTWIFHAFYAHFHMKHQIFSVFSRLLK